MQPAASFDYDRAEVSRVYAAARTLPSQAWAVWRAAIGGIVPHANGPIRTIIDAGCGTGRFSATLAELFEARVVGLDPSEKMLAQARAGVVDPRCTFQSGSLEALPVEAGAADLVFLSMVYHHVRDWPAAHRELQRVLRPGGMILIRTSLREVLPRYLWSRFFPAALAIDEQRMPSAADITTQMTAAGFRAVEHRSVSHGFAEDARAYLAKIRLRGLSGLQMISDEEFARGLEALTHHLRTVPTDTSAFTEDMDLFCFVKPTA
jgi:SAM-dependent methyltransferase